MIIIQSLLYSYSTPGADVEPKSNSTRIVFATLFLSSLVMFSMYSATLTSFLTVNKTTLPFDSLETLYTMTNYRVLVFEGNVYENELQSGSDIERKIYSERLDRVSKLTPEKIFDKMAEGNYAYVGNTHWVYSRVGPTCKIVNTKTPIKRSQYAMAMTKDSMYRDIFNY